MSAPVRLSVMGAGLIGKRHIEHILARPEAALSSIVDPAPAARELAVSLKVDWFPSFQDLLSENRPDGVVVATPTKCTWPTAWIVSLRASRRSSRSR